MENSKKSLIIVPFAHKVGEMARTAPANEKTKLTYLQNCCVSLVSAKRNNDTNTDVALVTNIDLPYDIKSLLEKNQILILREEFDEFNFNSNMMWCLAFYKLCALSKAVAKTNYDYYAYMDSDTFVQHSFNDIWEECTQNILMYDINHGLRVNDYNIIISEFEKYYGDKRYITHYGGEFFAANKENCILFIKKCKDVYQKMINDNIVTTKGDEFITSIAAEELKLKVKNAGAYIYRFWTGEFNLISTCYKYNPVTVLHLPDEKQKGLIYIYQKYISKNKMPNNKTVWRKCHCDRKFGLLKKVYSRTIKKIL